MRYLGGKFRQSREIVAAIRRLNPDFRTYAEPFCGAMWSACAAIREFPKVRYMLSDNNPYLMCFWKAAVEGGWNPPENPTEEDYQWYKKRRPVGDPMTGYIGFAYGFAGQFFGTPARTNGVFKGSYATTVKKIAVLREANVLLRCTDYTKVKIPSGAAVYLDPPYQNRNAQVRGSQFDRAAFVAYAHFLSRRCFVLTTEFVNDGRWQVLHNWGDTVIKHHLDTTGQSAANELLMRVRA